MTALQLSELLTLPELLSNANLDDSYSKMN